MRTVTITLAMTLVTNLKAAAGPPLEWSGCVNETLRANPHLVAAREAVAQAAANRTIARSQRRPQVSAGVETTRHGNESEDGYSLRCGVTATQMIFDGGRSGAMLQGADQNRQLAQIAYEIASVETRMRLSVALAELLRIRDLVSLAAEIVQRRAEQTRLVELRHDAGREHRGALLTAEAKESLARFELTRARRALQVSCVALMEVMGRKGQEHLSGLDVTLPENSLAGLRWADDLLQKPAKAMPDLEALAVRNPRRRGVSAERQIAEARLRMARADRWPVLGAAAETGIGSMAGLDGSSWSVGVTLSVPLYRGGRTGAVIEQEAAGLRRAQAREQALGNEILGALWRRWAELQDALEDRDVRDKFLEAARQRAMIADTQYSGGQITFDNWTLIEDEYALARKAAVDARAQAHVAEARWLEAGGRTLEDEVR